ncbi:hypothetical protein FRB94_008708 [Tulasnella sp. JGI-2019a]|nr:hypothetical protein FRB94_008708 [Tulasnella sp. JGI-2019a]
MASPATTARSPVTSTRRIPPGSATHSPSSSIASNSAMRGGAIPRSAVSPRPGPLTTPAAKRASARAVVSPPPPLVNGDLEKASRETIAAALNRETEEKESLLLQIQNHEQTISTTTGENANLVAALSTAESRLAELYADQTRMEEDMAAKLEVIDKLRVQVKELEKEKRDSARRYNEQTATFEAERQAFYDSEQHLKSRIQSLSQARRQSITRLSPVVQRKNLAHEPEEDHNGDESSETPENHSAPARPEPTPAEEEATEPAEMTALKMELTTLSTSHASIQNTLHLLQTQLNDFKTINKELQEENESYNILLRERTLSGRFDIMRATGTRSPDEDEGVFSHPVEDTPIQKAFGEDRLGRSMSVRSRSTTLDVVPEHDEVAGAPSELGRRDESPESKHSKRSRRAGGKTGSPVLRGESLGDLPITGPGLDLAAELGRAENKDILEGRVEPSRTETAQQEQSRAESEEMQSLRTEVKSLKDANKALSLYASKIIDRIIAQEGFEHVLAADYESPVKSRNNGPPKPSTGSTSASKQAKPPVAQPVSAPSPQPEPPASKPRPKSLFFAASKPELPVLDQSTAGLEAAPPMGRSTTSTSEIGPSAPAMAMTSSAPTPIDSADKRTKRGMSMDWKGITSLFGGSSAAPTPDPKNDKFRPLTLNAATPIIPANARKVETVEDANDRKERERLLATMKLMGIETPAPSSNPLSGSQTPPQLQGQGSSASQPPLASPPPSGRVAFFTRFRSSEAVPQAPAAQSSPLTTEALEQAEAESTLAALDAREKSQAAEYAKGKGGSGFTELNNGKVSLNRRVSSRGSGKSAAGKPRMSIDDDGSGSGVARGGSPHSRTESVHTLFSAGADD